MSKARQKIDWKNQTERGNILGIRLMIYIYKILGESLCKMILFPVLLYFYLTGRQMRGHLKDFYKQLQKHAQSCEVEVLSKKSCPFVNIVNFGFGIIDRVSLWTGKFSLSRVRAHQNSILYEYAASGKGGLIFSSHLGNFELCRALGRKRFTAKMNVLVDISNAKKINAVMQSVNKNFLADIIPVSEIDIALAVQLKEKVENGEFVIIAADRVNHSRDHLRNNSSQACHSVRVPFLGKEAAFPIGPYVLAKALACPVFTLYCFRANDGQYEVFFHRLFDRVTFDRRQRNEKIREYAAVYAEQLASYCMRYPTQWYNFYNFWK